MSLPIGIGRLPVRILATLLLALMPGPQSPSAGAWHEMVVTDFGPPEVLQWQERTQLLAPGPGEVRIRVLAASASFTDTLVRKGLYPIKADPPFVPGYDLVGVIDARGEGVQQFAVGQRVADLTVWGAYTEYAIRPAKYLVPVPDGVDSGDAVSLVLSYLTAYQMLHRSANVQPGATILVHGASGAVGSALTQLAVLRGIRVFGTASGDNQRFVRDLGATPLDYREQDFVAVIDQATGGGGVDAAFDAIGLDNFRRSYRTLAGDGTLVTYGLYTTSANARAGQSLSLIREFLGFQWQKLRWAWFGEAGKRMVFYSITDMREQHPDWFREDLTALFDLVRRGQLAPSIWRTLPLSEAAQAHRMIESGEVRGKIVLESQP